MIMEAKKPHNMLFASWRPRKASGMIQFKSKGLRTRRAAAVNPGPEAGECVMRGLGSSSKTEKRRVSFSSLCLPFYSGAQEIG